MVYGVALQSFVSLFLLSPFFGLFYFRLSSLHVFDASEVRTPFILAFLLLSNQTLENRYAFWKKYYLKPTINCNYPQCLCNLLVVTYSM